jgi:hypothetical protein
MLLGLNYFVPLLEMQSLFLLPYWTELRSALVGDAASLPPPVLD